MPLEEIVPLLGDRAGAFLGTPVKLNSLRLRTFKSKGLQCAECGLAGTHFAVERVRGSSEPFHVNLYAMQVWVQ